MSFYHVYLLRPRYDMRDVRNRGGPLPFPPGPYPSRSPPRFDPRRDRSPPGFDRCVISIIFLQSDHSLFSF